MNPPSPDPRRRSNVFVLGIITFALLGGWLLMWGSGMFERLGRGMSVIVLAMDVVVLAVLWSLLWRRDGPGGS